MVSLVSIVYIDLFISTFILTISSYHPIRMKQFFELFLELGMKENGNKVLVVGATNRPDSIDPALRRAGRFDREVSLGIPNKEARAAILKVHAAHVTIAPEVSLEKIAELTPGFVGADLVALIREASMAAVNR